MTTDRELIERLIELRKLKYMGDCKCGKCQLVPLDLLNAAIERLSAGSGWRDGVEAAAKICDAEHRANLHSVAISLGSDARAMTAYKLAERIRALPSPPGAQPSPSAEAK